MLAAAVRSKARVIVTENRSDFPMHALEPYEIEAQTIDEFLTWLFWQHPDRMVRIVNDQASDLIDPPVSVNELLDELAGWATMFVELIRSRT